MAEREGTQFRPHKYPDALRQRAFDVWLVNGRHWERTRRQLKWEFARVPNRVTLMTWALEDGWAARAAAYDAQVNSLTGFKRMVWKDYQHAPHLDLIDRKLTELVQYIDTGGAEGIRRLMIFLPPRHGKSMTVSRLFPAWFLGHHPDHQVLLTAYAMSLVARHSTFTRKLIRSTPYGDLFPQVRLAVGDGAERGTWTIEGHAGGLEAMGINGAVTGKGSHILIIDDPVKNRQAVASAYRRDTLWEDYRQNLFTRLEPNGAIVLMMTRWHEDDLAGRLLKTEGEKWEVIKLAAIAEGGLTSPPTPLRRRGEPVAEIREEGIEQEAQRQGEEGIKKIEQEGTKARREFLNREIRRMGEKGKEKIEQEGTKARREFLNREIGRMGEKGKEKIEQEGAKARRDFEEIERHGEGVDMLGRKAGEALWAARYPLSELEDIRASVGPTAWAALYQQNPLPVEGGLFKGAWVEDKRDENVPSLARVYVGIDPAASAGERAAETGIIVAGVDKRKPSHAYVLADLSVKATPAEWARIALEAVNTSNADAIVLEVNQGGEMAANTLRSINPHVRIQQVRATRDKFLRADPVAALYEQGRVHHAGAFPKLEEQMIRWTPGDPSPDRLDALVWTLTELMITVKGVGLR